MEIDGACGGILYCIFCCKTAENIILLKKIIQKQNEKPKSH